MAAEASRQPLKQAANTGWIGMALLHGFETASFDANGTQRKLHFNGNLANTRERGHVC